MSDFIEVDGLRVGPNMWLNAQIEIEQLRSMVEELESERDDILNIAQQINIQLTSSSKKTLRALEILNGTIQKKDDSGLQERA